MTRAGNCPAELFGNDGETNGTRNVESSSVILGCAPTCRDGGMRHLYQLVCDPSRRLRPGQIRQVIAAVDAPHGRPLGQTEMVEVTWTVDAGEEDLDVLRMHSPRALRRVRILRLVDETLDQGGAATQEDLAKALGVTARTIRSDIAALEAKGYRIATRGKLRGVGRGHCPVRTVQGRRTKPPLWSCT